MKRLAVLVSGEGTILQAIIDAGIPVSLVIADRMCRAIEIAQEHGIKCEIVLRADYVRDDNTLDREAFTERITECLLLDHIDLVMMAGFMTFLAKFIFTYFARKILNTHPSLLPKFKGNNAVAEAFDAGVEESGCTLHYATEFLDDESGIIDQRVVRRLPNDTVKTWHERIKVEERVMIPENLKRLMAA